MSEKVLEKSRSKMTLENGSMSRHRALPAPLRAVNLVAGIVSIPGLYAVGNDMASLFRGVYVGPGITLGPALVFAYRAVMHIANVPADAAERVSA